MDILIRNLPDQITEKQVERFFRPHLTRLSIKTFGCRKNKGRGIATIAIEDLTKAETFLKIHGQKESGHAGFAKVQQKLYHLKRPIYCCRSKHPPDPFLLQSLKQEEHRILANEARKANSGKVKEHGRQRDFDITSIACGQWDYTEGGTLAFMSHFQESRGGRMIFGKRAVLIDIHLLTTRYLGHRIEIPYDSVDTFTVGTLKNPTVTFSLHSAPKLYEDMPPEESLIAAMESLGKKKSRLIPKRKRVSAICKTHEIVVSSCLCYRFMLQRNSDIKLIDGLKNVNRIPESFSRETSNIIKSNFISQLTLLNTTMGQLFANVSFEVKFQFQRLAQNGLLPPARVVEIFKRTVAPGKDIDDSTLVRALQKTYQHIPFAGPHTEAEELNADAVYALLIQTVESARQEALYSDSFTEQHDHIAYIHKAMVTPVGIYLSGPEPEVKNRVLRKYSAFTNYFLQVSFLDEDGESVRYSRIATNDDVYHKRFKKVLEGVIMIAGRGYEVRRRRCRFEKQRDTDQLTVSGVFSLFSPISDLLVHGSIYSQSRASSRENGD